MIALIGARENAICVHTDTSLEEIPKGTHWPQIKPKTVRANLFVTEGIHRIGERGPDSLVAHGEQSYGYGEDSRKPE